MNLKSITLSSLRALVLGLIVFGTVTHIPKNAVTRKNKVFIALVVVVLFILLDYFSGALKVVRNWLCKLLCNCGLATEEQLNSGNSKNSGSDDDQVLDDDE